jgi:recombination associated protein RdgC
MSLHRGSLSYVRFFVDEVAPSKAEMLDAINLRAFRPLKASDEDEDRVGWCSVHHPIDLDLTHEKVFEDGHVNLGLRIDRYKIPGAIMKAHMREAETAMLAELGKERLSRAQREDLRAMVSKKLRERTMPVMRTFDLSWDLERGVVRFFGMTSKSHDVLAELFEKTFSLSLTREGVYTLADRIGSIRATALDAIADLHPFVLHREDDDQ